MSIDTPTFSLATKSKIDSSMLKSIPLSKLAKINENFEG